MTNTEVPVPASETLSTPAARTIALGRFRASVQHSRASALKAMGDADRLGESEAHQRLALVVSTLDDVFEAITQAHLTGQPISFEEESERFRIWAEEHNENGAELQAEAEGRI